MAAVGPGEVIVVDEGDSSQPSLSADGKRLLFVSGKRPAHNSPQVYVRDLNQRLDRRITFQNGNVARPRFHPRENVIVYSSSTDEDKEYPAFLREDAAGGVLPAWLRAGAEVYVHGLDTFDIKRLVTHAGFDGDARFAAGGRALTWTQVSGGVAKSIYYQRASGVATPIKRIGDNATQFTLAPDQRTAAWIAYDTKFDHARLMLRRNDALTEIAPEHATAKTDPEFSPDGAWLTWAEFDPARRAHACFVHRVGTTCVREVPFASAGDRRHPVISPDLGTYYFTAIGSDKSRVVSTRFDRTLCP